MVSQEITTTFITGIFGILGGGGLVGLISYFKLKPEKELASYPALINQIQTTLIDPLKLEVKELHDEVRTLRSKVNIYENHLMRTKKGEVLVQKTRKQFES